MKEKYARSLSGKYKCKQSWAEDCFCQCGDSGIVLSSSSLEDAIVKPEKTVAKALVSKMLPLHKGKGYYTTAFFEAFPRNPDTFIRGEGKTVEEAEKQAWNKLQKYNNCKEHEYEKRGYTNGAGFCKHCGLFKAKCFKPWEKCMRCHTKTFYTQDKNGNWWCENCWKLAPVEVMTETQIYMKKWQDKKVKSK